MSDDVWTELVRAGSTIAVADGAGLPLSVLPALTDAARTYAGDVRLLLGWCPVSPVGLDTGAFADVRTLMAGYGLRRLVDAGEVGYVPVRLGAAAALLRDVERPAVLVASVGAGRDGHRFTTEVAWMRAAVDAGATIAAVERPKAPVCDIGPALPADRVRLVAVDEDPPLAVAWGSVTDAHRAVAERVVPLIPAGARLQYGPGGVGTAVVELLDRPVRVDTGLVTDPVAELDRRGLLVGAAYAPYLAGLPSLYEWATGRVRLDRLEMTHDPVRLAGPPPLVAVNTALEIDLDGNVNVEAVGGSAVAGIGGQPDYAAAAVRASGGLSVIAVPRRRGRHTTLVERLAAPPSTPGHDIDVVVTDAGVADLRGLERGARRRAIAALWP